MYDKRVVRGSRAAGDGAAGAQPRRTKKPGAARRRRVQQGRSHGGLRAPRGPRRQLARAAHRAGRPAGAAPLAPRRGGPAHGAVLRGQEDRRRKWTSRTRRFLGLGGASRGGGGVRAAGPAEGVELGLRACTSMSTSGDGRSVSPRYCSVCTSALAAGARRRRARTTVFSQSRSRSRSWSRSRSGRQRGLLHPSAHAGNPDRQARLSYASTPRWAWQARTSSWTTSTA